jgi:hypothetical protein
MSSTPSDPDLADDIYDLQERYLHLVREILPAAARAGRDGRWPIREDHCFMRVILDHLFDACWYDHLDRRLVAYKQLSAQQLTDAIDLAERMLAEGPPLVLQMNVQSLRWRGRFGGRNDDETRNSGED